MITVKEFMSVLEDIMTEDQIVTLAKKLEGLSKSDEKVEVEAVGSVLDDFTVLRDRGVGGTAVNAKDTYYKDVFIDEGEERDGIDDLITRKKIQKQPRQTGKIEKVCSVCGKTTLAPRMFASTHYYRCEGCVG